MLASRTCTHGYNRFLVIGDESYIYNTYTDKKIMLLSQPLPSSLALRSASS